MVNNNCTKSHRTTSEATNTTAGNMTACNQTSGQLSQKTVTVIDEEAQHIQNSTEVHVYLKKSLLIVPPGQVPMTGLLVMALHHVTELKGVPMPVINAICTVAFLLKEIEECGVMTRIVIVGLDYHDKIVG